MCVVWWWKVLESRGRGGGCVTGERRPRGEIEVKVGAVEEKLNAIMELLLRAASGKEDEDPGCAGGAAQVSQAWGWARSCTRASEGIQLRNRRQ